MNTLGRTILKKYIKRTGDVRRMAEQLGMRRETVSRFLNGNHRPNIEHALKIEEVYQIPVGYWTQTIEE
jgi:transcriptional regulator with XRE-family HTH domain